MIANDKVILLADAEFGEDGVEDVVGGDVSGDFAEVVDNGADVLRNKVGGEVVAKSRTGVLQCLVCRGQCLIVAHIRYDDIV